MEVNISGYSDYIISDSGVVMSTKLGSRRLLKQIGAGKDRRYMRVTLCSGGARKYAYVHRLVAEHFLPNPMNLPWVNHIDLDTKNNDVENLEWCSPQYNIRHARDNGRCKVKIRSMDEADEIRRRHANGESGASIARSVGVSKETIYHVIHRLSWARLDEPASKLNRPRWDKSSPS